ncbi:amidohydrolase family protein [Streptomyces sp. NP160]|uniref:metal-dependent hydrolase family protein n=1 Tax=Streptomyces sp. NP160 TaxID=2586637 RepID=UPI001C57E062|nr:amidohydrolase family protein [Streptomyces sp. NP160]
MSPAVPLVVVGADVWDGESDSAVPATVVCESGRVTGVVDPGNASDAAVARVREAGGRVLEAGGRTVLPGLIDAHCHAYAAALSPRDIESWPLSYVALGAARRLEAALARGFTTVRDVAGGDAGLARALQEGLVVGPRYLYTGAALSQTGGHGEVRGRGEELCGCNSHLCEVVDGVDALRRAVRERFHDGAHAIKVMASGGVVSETDPIRVPQYSSEELRAVVDEAARRGSYVAAHAYSPEAIAHAVDAGVRSIEHGNLLDAATASLMAERGAVLVATLGCYEAMARRGADLGMSAVSQAKNTEVLAAGRDAVALAQAAGVPVGFGSDLMGPLEDEQLSCLRLQLDVLGPLQGLRSATSVNAEILQRPDLGRVREGSAADLLVVDGDPFARPDVLWGPPSGRTVVLSGAVA